MIRAVAIVLVSVLVILTRQLTSDIGTAVAEGPPGGGRGSGGERGGNGGGGAAAAAGGAGISDAAGVSSGASSSVEGNVSVSASAASAGGREDQPGTRTDLPSAIAQAARDAARYAADASREAFQSAEAAARAANSALSEAALVVRRETNRARNAAARAREEIDEAADRQTVSAVRAPSTGTVQSVRRRLLAQASFARGNALLEGRRYQEARNQFAEAVALDPEHDEARSLLAWSDYFLGDFRRAIFTFKTTLRRQPTWAGLYNGLGWSRLRVGRYQLAADAFGSALDRNPDYVDALHGLGSAMFQRGDYDLAISPLEKALYRSQGFVGPEPPEVTTMRGKLAWSLYYLERDREALAMFIRASLAAPDSHQLQVGMGWCYLRLGQKDDARAAFQRAAKLGSDDETVREGLRLAGL
jgi:tetratricopeptide (TPR) repeat protein